MKKALLTFGILLALFIAGVYVFIPSKLNLSGIAHASCSSNAANRLLTDRTQWSKWWPGQKKSVTPGDTTPAFAYNNTRFLPGYGEYNIALVGILYDNDTLLSNINIIPVKIDSTTLFWQSSVSMSSNPFTRLRQYIKVRSIETDIQAVLKGLTPYLEDQKKIYGMQINLSTVTDSLLLTIKNSYAYYPGTKDIYALIAKLKTNIVKQQALQAGYPMAYIQKKDNNYELMVAIPVNKVISNSREFAFKRMLKDGLIMEATVSGGESRVRDALQKMEDFKTDYQKVSPAIPFQSLITNRLTESDTSKWITKIYYPIL